MSQFSTRISVIGLGKLGAPMAAVFAAKGFAVVGLDLNENAVEAINNGRAPIREPRLQEFIDAAGDRLSATTDYDEAITKSDATFIVVPTPSGPDWLFSNKYLLDAISNIGKALRRKTIDHLVVVTSTVTPGSTGGEIRSALEAASGRKVGRRLGLCYSPEFVALGSVVDDMLKPEMLLIGESDKEAGDILESIYLAAVENDPTPRRMNWINAELAKLAVNTFVTTKISYANMIAEMCDHLDGADCDVVTSAVGTDSRIGQKYLKGAIGYGGPCFPRDNKAFAALGRKLGVNAALATATDQINDHQVQRLFGAIEAHATAGAPVAVLGMSYKPLTEVIEQSQGIALSRLLIAEGYKVLVADPLGTQAAEALLGNHVAALPPEEAVRAADVIAVTTPWPEFSSLSADAFAREGQRAVVIDPWRLFDAAVLKPVADVVHLGRGALFGRTAIDMRRDDSLLAG